ncbi:mycothiol synthase [Knoellia subterranea]|uniref:Mycothiol acetyltransferase n=1 Tax=Knoellia subterranea KCTC 19937 TaxID=1385521 RepID=A0A0A0JHI4_9MICO|nr:mycothiol synthase [Knoellia subterranea]KGN36573.1 mycothiol acetyltransferase [Knoellia subterranea KCTC 19937]
MSPTVEVFAELDEAVVDDIRAVVGRAVEEDGVEAISEAFRLALVSPRSGVTHFVAYAGESPSADLLGYAAVDSSGSAELVVEPGSRRQGVGRALLDAVLEAGATGVWAHGDLPAARALAADAGLVSTRELHVMKRPLTDADGTNPVLPEGFSARTFKPGRDEQAWLEVNGLAFATHPEQGSITLDDLRQRMEQDWFDPEGFFLVEDTTQTDDEGQHPLAAFHWTKREPSQPDTGEVYVVGVHPAYQGKGLAGPLTGLGTAYLARQGCTEVELYVDGDNTRALATYRRAGFEDVAVHVVYGRPTAP